MLAKDDQLVEPHLAAALEDVFDQLQAHQSGAAVEQGGADEVGPHEHRAQQFVAPGDRDLQHEAGDHAERCQQDGHQADRAHERFDGGEERVPFLLAHGCA